MPRDQVVVVAGGTGAIGEPIASALLSAGATVVVPSRSRDRLAAVRDRLAGSGDRLVTLVGDVGDPDGAEALLLEVRERAGDPHHVVASLGGWWSGASTRTVAPAVFRRVVDGGLFAHLACAQALLPALDGVDGATYTLLNGSGARQPVAGSGAVNVSAAGQLMLARCLAAEQPDDGARVRTLVIGTPVLTRDRPEGPDSWLTGADVAEAVLGLVADPQRGGVVVDLPGRTG